jgi:NAD+ synthase
MALVNKNEIKKMKISSKIINWLNEYSKDNGQLSFIIGISGGIDSSVVSTLCAMTGIKTVVVSMPIHQKSDQLERANNHIDWLISKFPNVEKRSIDLTPTFEEFKKNLNTNNQLSLANLRSRIRMCTLYHFSTIENGIVVGTGNKVEDFGIGFFTKYGDGGVDISPIADLLKTEVYDIAKELNINEEIIKAKPTDGLWEDDRCDEDQIGASYKELEWAMEFRGDKKNITEREKEILKIYNNLNRRNNHKMIQIPIFKKS